MIVWQAVSALESRSQMVSRNDRDRTSPGMRCGRFKPFALRPARPLTPGGLSGRSLAVCWHRLGPVAVAPDGREPSGKLAIEIYFLT